MQYGAQIIVKDNLRQILSKVTDGGDLSQPIYYTVSFGRNLVAGLIFSIAALWLGWTTVTMIRSGYVTEGMLFGILFATAFYAGPVQIYRLVRELAARVKRYREYEE